MFINTLTDYIIKQTNTQKEGKIKMAYIQFKNQQTTEKLNPLFQQVIKEQLEFSRRIKRTQILLKAGLYAPVIESTEA